jgi:peptide subunit release factor RF-3
VDAVFEGTSISSARWITCDDKKMLADFERHLLAQTSRLMRRVTWRIWRLPV